MYSVDGKYFIKKKGGREINQLIGIGRGQFTMVM